MGNSLVADMPLSEQALKEQFASRAKGSTAIPKKAAVRMLVKLFEKMKQPIDSGLVHLAFREGLDQVTYTQARAAAISLLELEALSGSLQAYLEEDEEEPLISESVRLQVLYAFAQGNLDQRVTFRDYQEEEKKNVSEGSGASVQKQVFLDTKHVGYISWSMERKDQLALSTLRGTHIRTLRTNVLDQPYEFFFRVCHVGEWGAGKTTLMSKIQETALVHVEATSQFQIAPDFLDQTIDGYRCRIMFSDTNGMEKFRHLPNSLYRGAHILFICLDASQDEEHMVRMCKCYLQEVERYACEGVTAIICLTRCDLVPNFRNTAWYPQVLAFAELTNRPVIATSAITGLNVEAHLDLGVRMALFHRLQGRGQHYPVHRLEAPWGLFNRDTYSQFPLPVRREVLTVMMIRRRKGNVFSGLPLDVLLLVFQWLTREARPLVMPERRYAPYYEDHVVPVTTEKDKKCVVF